MAQKHCRTFQAAELGRRTLETTSTDRQTTDGRATAYSERERELAFAKIILHVAISAVHSYNRTASTYM